MTPSRPSSSASSRGSPSSCRSRAPRTCGSSPPSLGWEDPGAAFTAVVQLGTMAAVLLYFRARPVADRRRTWLREPARPGAARRARRAHGLVHRPRHDPDRDLRPHLPATRSRAAARNLYLIGCDADRARPRAAAAPSSVGAHATATSTTSTARDAARHRLRPGAARSCPASRARARRSPAGLFRGFDRESRRALLVPALGPGRRALRPVRGCARSATPGGAGAVPTCSPRCSPSSSATRRSPGCCATWSALDRDLRGLPRRAGHAGDRAHRRRRHLVAFSAHGRPRARPPAPVGLPPAGREDPRGLLLRRLLQPAPRSCWRPTATTRAC